MIKWEPATATWYGSPNGAGTDGGACGYGSLPNTPYGSDVGAGSPILFMNGIGCGTCFEVKCVDGQLCSPQPVNVVITDECPGGYCSGGRTHFDLSGTAFGKMASGSANIQHLLAAGVLNVLYRRAPCIYKSQGVVFQVADGSTPFWFETVIRYLDGPGDLATVELQQFGSSAWQPMSQVWGANWCLNAGGGTPLRAPFSIRLTALQTGEKIIAHNVIPANWAPQHSYSTGVNFDTRNY
ncbi:hypothetical protein SELMODRAFT_171427 [Selaginella moellendorffii]|uniref:Expansin-like EG45 domain-containing protein n=2 Tax=Selaginella moellendorffii TaxID=88036 RepID=D8RGX2_SELML|nr:hypothetical protein SELMODRAFT_108691 [Selaginella moellendorffii]EFJ28439.1 hypothetical protein SELMODRAFT_171427 [Selaginella moellendorffii]